jgi:hypothetical protein
VVKETGRLTDTIREYKRKTLDLNKMHRETERLRQVGGVGPITALDSGCDIWVHAFGAAALPLWFGASLRSGYSALEGQRG